MPNNKNIPGYVFKGKRVVVVHSDKNAYQHLVGTEGLVEVAGSGSSIGVRLDYHNNSASAKGLYWFSKHELRIIDEEYLKEKEVRNIMNKPEGFPYIAKVVLLEDVVNKKEFEFALYTDDYLNLERKDGSVTPGQLVVVPITPKQRLALGRIVEVYPAAEKDENSTHPYSEVVGVVNSERYNRHLAHLERQKALTAVQKQLDEELEKLAQERRDSSHYAHVIDTMFPGNETLNALLAKMKELEGGE